MTETNGFEGWAVIELMGHRRLAGYVTEVEIAGKGMLRLDIPVTGPEERLATQFYSPQSLYCITPTTEETARQVAHLGFPKPVQRWELPAAEERPESRGPDLFEEEPFDEDDEF